MPRVIYDVIGFRVKTVDFLCVWWRGCFGLGGVCWRKAACFFGCSTCVDDAGEACVLEGVLKPVEIGCWCDGCDFGVF